jgi:hypothetical protein
MAHCSNEVRQSEIVKDGSNLRQEMEHVRTAIVAALARRPPLPNIIVGLRDV